MRAAQILWTLSEETSGKSFERLCVDLLYRNGFPRIRPTGGPQDAGRDAETGGVFWRDREKRRTFFQFSVRKDWKGKFYEDVEKVASSDHDIRHFVFVTPRRVPETTNDEIRIELRTQYGWLLTIFDREWLRLQLEEANPEIAERHLGIAAPQPEIQYVSDFDFNRPPDPDIEKAWILLESGDFRRAAAELRDYVRINPNSSEALSALAWCQYNNGHYREALQSISRALQQNQSESNRAIRGCILAELGIREKNSAAVEEAKSIFRDLVGSSPSWTAAYNLGNVLSEQGEYEAAVDWYKTALDRKDSDAKIWKNLGSAYHHLDRHEEEFECFDRALELDPQNPNALLSKGVSCLIDHNNPTRAIPLIEASFEADPDLTIHWPYAWYWLSRAHYENGDPDQALEQVQAGLRQCPGDEYLTELKIKITTEAAYSEKRFVSEAIHNLQERLSSHPADIRAIYHLARLYCNEGDDEKAWDVIESLLSTVSEVKLRQLELCLEEAIQAIRLLPSYHEYRHQCPLGLIELQTGGMVKRGDVPELTDFVWLGALITFGTGFDDLMAHTKASDERDEEQVLNEWTKVLDERHREVMLHVARATGRMGDAEEIAEAQHTEEYADFVRVNGIGLSQFDALEYERLIRWVPIIVGMDEQVVDRVASRASQSRDSEEYKDRLIVELIRSSGYTGGN